MTLYGDQREDARLLAVNIAAGAAVVGLLDAKGSGQRAVAVIGAAMLMLYLIHEQ